MTFLYFCYGSNMLTQRMRVNCPSARKKCIGLLKEFKLAFEGYADDWKGATATVVSSPGASVWGIVWEISKQEEEKLDKQEFSYKPINIDVEKEDGDFLLCKSYQKLKTSDSCTLPSLVYKTVMIKGAKEHMLPDFYIKEIEAFKDNGYKGEVNIPINVEQ